MTTLDGSKPFNPLEHGGYIFFVNKERVLLQIPEIGKFTVQPEALFIKLLGNYKGHLNGMCGNSNLVMKGIELKGIKTCTFTKPALEVASHRVQTVSCPQLRDTVKAELEKEETQCQSGHFGNVGYENGNGMSLPRKGYDMGLGVSGVARTG